MGAACSSTPPRNAGRLPVCVSLEPRLFGPLLLSKSFECRGGECSCIVTTSQLTAVIPHTGHGGRWREALATWSRSRSSLFSLTRFFVLPTWLPSGAFSLFIRIGHICLVLFSRTTMRSPRARFAFLRASPVFLKSLKNHSCKEWNLKISIEINASRLLLERAWLQWK